MNLGEKGHSRGRYIPGLLRLLLGSPGRWCHGTGGLDGSLHSVLNL